MRTHFNHFIHLYITGLIVACSSIFVCSCSPDSKNTELKPHTDSLIKTAYDARDYHQMLTILDQQEDSGSVEGIQSSYWRGYAYSRLQMNRQAETYWKKALTFNISTDEDAKFYGMAASHLSTLLLLKGDYEGTINVCIPVLATLKEKGYTMNPDYACLHASIGCCQLHLGKEKEAEENYEHAYEIYQDIIQAENGSSESYSNAIIGIITITDNLLHLEYYSEAFIWTERFAELLDQYKKQNDAKPFFIDKQSARLYLYRACALEGLGRKAEAALAYHAALKTQYTKTGDGKMEATNYLIAAHRWSEAADNFQILDGQMSLHGLPPTLDNINNRLVPKFRANLGAHRTDSALAVADYICTALDSAIIWQKNDDAAELAIIYDTQRKEMQIAQQQSDINRQRLLTSIVVFTLVIVFLTVYSVNRRRSAIRLQKAYDKLAESNAQLTIANARAEESSKMKTNFIQQVSHEIRTPLNILSGFTQVITTPNMELDDATRADINKQIIDNTNRITGLVNKMLELSDVNSRATIERTDEVPAVQIAAEAIEASGVASAPHLDFDLQFTTEAESQMVRTHLSSATRALSLLLDNARKFTRGAEATGDVQITTKQTVHLCLSVSNDSIFFTIEDSGIGIAEKDAERIFEEFVQLNEYYDGTGIGLTVARSLARRLGGDITLDTTYGGLGKGARFVMQLPL